MKKVFLLIAVFMLGLLASYSIVSFVAWELNPGKWPNGARFMSVILSIATAAIPAGVIFETFKK